MRKVVFVRFVVLAALLLGSIFIYGIPNIFHTAEEGLLKVTFFDVGQGDAIFIKSPVGIQVLIDGGRNAGVLRLLGKEMGFFDRSIDIVLATHPDQDHIGGLVDVLARYDVQQILHTENTGESGTAKAFIEGMENENATLLYVRRGDTFDLGGGAMLTILFPDRDPSMLESNTSSIIARLTYGESEFIFTGDAPKSVEEYLVVLGEDIQSDVLKVGHHGSKTSTNELFLDAVDPAYAIISAGKDNRYGHPHASVVKLLEKAGVIIENTAERGSMTFISNGVELELR